eukprot:g14513.t1
MPAAESYPKKGELSSLAKREVMLRRICEKRVQNLELEVMLLSEQLRASGKRRERADIASRQSAELSEEDGGIPTPAERNQQQHPGLAVDGTSHEHASFGPSLRAGCEGHARDKDREQRRGVVGRLLEENSRVGSAVRQLQGEGRRSKRRIKDHTHPGRDTSTDTSTRTRTRMHTVRPQTKGVEPGNVEATVKDDENVDLDMALSKIKALTGMIRAQEEIEMLLGRELEELKSTQARTRESVWRLLIRWGCLLHKSGYEVEKDARSEGVLQELQQRIGVEERQLEGGSPFS